jgi:group I intron endonuclease
MNSGIYLITNIINGKKYIGSSSRLHRRWREHVRDLERGVHQNPYFQKAWDKHGLASFQYSVLEECDRTQLLARESFWIEAHQSFQRELGYNLCRFPQHYALGLKRRPETIARMSKALSGQNHPGWGKKLPKSQVKKMADAQRGVSKPTSGSERKIFELLSPEGKLLRIKGLRVFCREQDLSPSMICRVLSGKQAVHKGWSLSS